MTITIVATCQIRIGHLPRAEVIALKPTVSQPMNPLLNIDVAFHVKFTTCYLTSPSAAMFILLRFCLPVCVLLFLSWLQLVGQGTENIHRQWYYGAIPLTGHLDQGLEIAQLQCRRLALNNLSCFS